MWQGEGTQERGHTYPWVLCVGAEAQKYLLEELRVAAVFWSPLPGVLLGLQGYVAAQMPGWYVCLCRGARQPSHGPMGIEPWFQRRVHQEILVWVVGTQQSHT